MREVEIALAFTPEPWVEALNRHFADHGGARVRQLLVDPALLLEEHYDVLVTSHRWSSLTRGLVEQVQDRGRRVLGVFDRHEPAGRSHLEALGVDGVVESDAAPSEFLDILGLLATEVPASDTAQSSDGAVDSDASLGRLLVVGGPPGGGRTEVAIELTRAASGSGHRVALVDGDEVAPSVAQRLGLAIEPNLRSAVDAVEHGTGSLDACFQVHHVGTVLVGLANVATWDQLRPGEMVRTLGALRRRFDLVLVDIAASVEDVGAPGRGRHALTRAVLEQADVVLAVAGGTPVGVARLLTWLTDVGALAPEADACAVVNRAPSDGFRRREIAAEISRALPVVPTYFVPPDPRVERAVWDGDHVRRGAFTKAVGVLLSEVISGEGASAEAAA